MLKIKIYVPERLSTNCRKLIYLACSVAEKYAEHVDVEIDKSEVEEEYPKPFIRINDYLLGKDIKPESLEKVVIEELKKEGKKEGF